MARTRLITGVTTGALLCALLSAGQAAGAEGTGSTTAGPNGAPSTAVATGETHQIPPGATGTATYTGTVDVGDLAQLATAPTAAPGGSHAAMRVPGWFTGPDVGTTRTRSAVSSSPQVTTPTVVRLNQGGTTDAQSSCFCQPPDTNGAIGAKRIVEAVNLALTVYKRGGALVSRTSLASFFPTSRSISDPRILYDNAAKRWILVFIPIPDNSSSPPELYLAASAGKNPAGSWFTYTIGFSGGLFPPGTLLDYPMAGQDANAAIIGSNNFQLNSGGNFNYINSTAFAVPKAAMYSGAGFSFPAFGVEFGTHPAVPRGKPLQAYSKSYLLAANGGGGYTLYYLTNTAGTPSMVQQGTSPGGLWSPPPLASQPAPNQGVFLDTLDGRIQSPPVQADNFLWFTHAVAIGAFPTVQYGAIYLGSSGTGGLSVTSEYAYASGTSNDWNPSLALAEPSVDQVRIFLNWAVDNPTAGENVGQRVSGVGPGEGVPSLAGIGTTLFTGSGTSFNTRFGDYSSATIDVKNVSRSCKYNTQALIVNEVFNGGDWQTRLARVGYC